MTRRLLVASIGNIFFGDDAFGVEVVRELAQRQWPPEVRIMDFGIRGFDLACALTGDYDAAILVDAAPRGGPPGTLYVIEPELTATDTNSTAGVEAHSLDPAKALRLARELGQPCPWVRIVACEPLTFGSDEEPALGLSEPVRAAVGEAVRLVESLVWNYLGSAQSGNETNPSGTF
jgi:hydrogenase maturation protease